MAAAHGAAHLVGAAVIGTGLLLLGGAQPQAQSGSERAATAHVRSMNPAAQTLIARACAASPTVASIVSTLEASDVIVMVSVTFMNEGLAGDLRFLTATACARTLCVRIDRLPDTVFEQIRNAADPAKEGYAIALHTIQELRHLKGIHGIHITALFWEEIIPALVRESGLLSR